MRSRRLSRLRDLVQPGISLLVWVYLYVVTMLVAWVVVVSLVTGWDPVVLDAGSMSPSIRTGDVVLVAEVEDRLAQGAVVTFDDPSRPGRLVTHRVFEVLDDGYLTKGDANASPDAGVVADGDVRGVARLVVPYVGLPIVWWQSGDMVAVAALAVLTALAIGLAVAGRPSRSRAFRRDPSGPSPVVAERALRRVRVLVGALIVAQYMTDRSRFELLDGQISPTILLGGALIALTGLNVASVAVSRHGGATAVRRFPIIELAVDTALVVAITAPSGTAGIGWVLFALPIVEAATRFRLTGALVHWMGLTTVTVVTRIWILAGDQTAGGLMLGELERTLDQLSVLLLVVLPGAYLAEQLLNDVIAQIHATRESEARNRILQRVVAIGRDVNRLDAEIVTTLTASALALGFDGADAWARSPDGSWRRLGTAGPVAARLPGPGAAASGLRPADLPERAVVVDASDSDPDELGGLADAQLSTVARIQLVEVDGTVVVLRAALGADTPPNPLALEALELLASQASVAMRNDRLIAELRDAHEGLFRQASQDALTGLANRSRFLELLREAVDRERHGAGSGVAVLFLDLDGFKLVNDRLGHEHGDTLLCAVGDRIVGRLRDNDAVARFGGDEFTVLLDPATGRDSVRLVAGRIHAAICEPFGVAHEQVSIGVSIGIAMLTGPDDSPDEILQRADMAMYHAKSRADTSIAFYEDEMGDRYRYRTRLAADLPEAFRDGQLRLLYQPIREARDDRRIVGAEALLRWTHPELGPVPPPQAVDLAEQLGIRDSLTSWVLRESCDAAAVWNTSRTDPFIVTANLTPWELESPNLLGHVGDALERSGLASELLILELSERILGPDNPASDANLFGLATMSVRLMLDDFGQGRTSLAFLQSLPIEGIKLDRAFVVNSVKSESDQIIVQSVVRLAHELGLFVVAEGVEEAEHLTAVEAMGCELLQGYYLGRPMERDELSRLLAAQPSSSRRRRSPLDAAARLHTGGAG